MVDRQADKFALQGQKRAPKGCVVACLAEEPAGSYGSDPANVSLANQFAVRDWFKT